MTDFFPLIHYICRYIHRQIRQGNPGVFTLACKAVVVFISLISILYAFPLVLFAQPATPMAGTGRPWHVLADHLAYSRPDGVYTASGHVTITSGTRRLSADTIRFDEKKMHAVATGNVVFFTGPNSISGDRMDIDLDSGTGTIENGLIFIEKNHFYIHGNKIKKTGRTTYIIKNASITACDGPNPDWHLTGKKIDIAMGGFGTIRDAKFWVGKIPAFYLPTFRFPVLRKRQSGFLLPQLGYSSRMGARLLIPWFAAINRSTDATLYFEHLQKRGEKIGAEFRYTGAKGSKATLMADGFSDRHVDDGKNANSRKWGYTDDTAIRPNSGRYWFRMKSDRNFSENLSTKLDLDIVSDQDYLKDFEGGTIGYNSTKAEFEKRFGRDINDKNDPMRTNYFNINRRWTSFSFNGDLLWYEDATRRSLFGANDILQHIPSLTFDALKQPLFDSPFFYTIDSDYAYLYKKDGAKGHRADIHPRIYLPIHLGPWVTIEPYAGIYQTSWYLDTENSNMPAGKHFYHRQVYDLGGEISSELSRIYSGKGEKRLRHVIIPKLSYAYTPDIRENKYPQFNDQESVTGQNIVSLSITQLFISKKPGAKKNGVRQSPSYRQVCRFFIEQPYDFSINTDPGLSDPGTRLRPLYAELDVTPTDMLSIRADGKWDHDKNRLDSGNISFLLDGSDNRLFRVEYRYTKDINNSVYTELSIPVSAAWTLFGDYERNISDNLNVRTSIGARYEAQCWALNFSYIDEQDDRKIAATIELSGLGAFYGNNGEQ